MAKMIKNLKEFLESRGYALEENSLWYYGRCLYKYSFGPWVSWQILEKDQEKHHYTIRVIPNKNLEAIFIHKPDLPQDLVTFFCMAESDEVYPFDKYWDLLQDYQNKHGDGPYRYNTTRSYGDQDDEILITGTYTLPQSVRSLYYEDDEASRDSLKLADKVIGITIGSIIEGADYDATPFTMFFPFSEEEYDRNLRELESEVSVEWEKNNSRYYSVVERKSGEKVLWCQWVEFDDHPKGNWDEEDQESLKLAKAAGQALFDWERRGSYYNEVLKAWGSTRWSANNIYIPGYADYRVKEEEPEWY